MASCWRNSVPRNEKLNEGLKLLKLLPLETFKLVLTKIQSKDAFTETDIENLGQKVQLKETDTRHVIETISYLNKHMSKVILKPVDLEKTLIEDFGIEDDKAQLWIQLWTKDIGQNFDLENLNELRNISWNMNIEAASSLFKKEAIPSATIQLKGTKSDTILNMNEEELTHLYNTLENIQAKLDM